MERRCSRLRSLQLVQARRDQGRRVEQPHLVSPMRTDMEIHLKIDIGLTPFQKRLLRHAVVIAAMVAAIGTGVAIASPIDTGWIASQQPLSASKLKADLDGLQAQLQEKGFVGQLICAGNCTYSTASGLGTTYSNITQDAAATCACTVTNGSVAGATLTAPANAAGTPASFGLSGGPGHYLVTVTGSSVCEPATTSERAVCAIRLLDGTTNVASGATAIGHITVGVSAPDRYQYGFTTTAGFSYSTSVNTTIRFQGNSLGGTNATQFRFDGSVPIEVRVYKL
jgi:hypothetical protein